jgi:prevent-host-death family protein
VGAATVAAFASTDPYRGDRSHDYAVSTFWSESGQNGRVKSVGIYEAKTQLPKLLAEIDRGGEPVTITRHGRPIARIVPVETPAPRREDAVEAMLAFGRAHAGALSGLSLKELIDAGRKY